MNAVPVVFLAFANDRVENTRYLRNLPTELRKISEALEPAVEAGLCEVVSLANATISQIIDTFQKKRYKDRIAIFHYGGHADGYQLLLESEEGKTDIAHGGGLVSFFKKQKSLKLIFLNGCSTEQQSMELVDAGVPVVIGTSSSIADDVATQLASRFYRGLGNGSSIDRSWREAKDEAGIRGGTGTTRGGFQLDEGGNFPWRFLVKKGAEIVKDWNLPDASDNPLFGLPEPPKKFLPEEPFRFLKWYGEDHAEIFFGRAFYIRELYERITDPEGSPLILLYGRSGVGKSSLLDAGLLPRIKQDCDVVYLRRSDGTSLLESLSNQLVRASETPSGTEPFSAKEAWLEKEKKSGKPLIIILDQVEEIYIHASKENDDELSDLLTEIKPIFADFDNRPKGKIMLSYRKEYHPEIEKTCLEHQIPKEHVFLQPLQRRDIIEVVNGLTSNDRLRKKYGIHIDELLPSVIADDLLADASSSVAPILQILLTKMWQLESGKDQKVFSLENYQRLKREGILLDDFFEQQLTKLKLWNPEPENSGLAMDLLNYHTSHLGTSNVRSLEKITERYQHRQKILDDLVAKCKELYLLFETGKGKITLAHDTLAPLIQNEFRNSDRPGQRALRILENKISLYALNQETYIDEEDLELVENGRNGMRFWLKKENELIEKSRKHKARLERERRRNRRFKIYSVLALIGLAAAVIWLVYYGNLKDKVNEEINTVLRIEKTDPTLAIRQAEKAFALKPGDLAIRQTIETIFGRNEFYNLVYEHDSPIRTLAVSPDGQMLLTGDTGGNLLKWDQTGSLMESSMIHSSGVNAIIFSSDGQFYATAGEDKKARVWDKNGNQVRTLENHGNAVTCLAFSPDGKHLVTGSRDQKLRFWNRETWNLENTIAAHEGTIHAAEFSPDNKLLITASEDGFAKLWSRNGELITTLAEHEDMVLCAAFSDDSRYILTGSRDKTTILWDAAGQQLVKMVGHDARVNVVRFSPSGETFFSAGDDQVVLQWDRKGNQLAKYVGHNGFVNALVIDVDGKYMFTGSSDNSAKRWSLKGKIQQEFDHFDQLSTSSAYLSGIGAAAFSPDGNSLATAGSRVYNDPVEEALDTSNKSQYIRIWHLESGKSVDLNGHKDGILSVAFSADSKVLVSGSRDGTARLWTLDNDTGENIESKIISQINGEVSAVAFSKDGSFFMTAGEDGICSLWDPKAKSISNAQHGDWITALAISHDGNHFATAGMDNNVKIWQTDSTNEPVLVLEGHTAAVISVAFSPDGKYLASGGEDNILNVWQTDGTLVLSKKYEGKNISGFEAIRSLSFLKDNKQILFGSEDGAATIIDIDGNISQTIRNSTLSIASVGISPDSKLILLAGDDGKARLNLTIDAWLKSDRVARF